MARSDKKDNLLSISLLFRQCAASTFAVRGESRLSPVHHTNQVGARQPGLRD